MLAWKSSARRAAPQAYIAPRIRWRAAFSGALVVATLCSVVMGFNNKETWRGVEAALLFALPYWTWAQYQAYSRSAVDMSALRSGMLSRRWLAENLLAALHALLILVEAGSFIAAEGLRGPLDLGFALTAVFLLIDFAIVVRCR